MRNIDELHRDIDSIGREIVRIQEALPSGFASYFNFYGRKNEGLPLKDNDMDLLRHRLANIKEQKQAFIRENQLNQVKSIVGFSFSSLQRFKSTRRDTDVFSVEIFRKYTQAVACLVMFLIGAPLGALIRKGGLGIPVLVSILFFILYYVLSITGEKWSKENVLDVPAGMWYTNVFLFLVGLLFLRKAWKDAPLFEGNPFAGLSGKIKLLFRRKTA